MKNSLAELPGGKLVEQGLDDLRHGKRTIPAALLEIARGRLTRNGLLPPREPEAGADPQRERELYRQLRAQGGDAYGRYNALLRELNSFIVAFERQNKPSESR